MKSKIKFFLSTVLYLIIDFTSSFHDLNKGKTRILVFHHLDEKERFKLVIKKINEKYNLISFWDYISGNVSENNINIIIAFDDGYKSWFENGFDIFREYNVRPMLFINSDYIDLNKKDAFKYCSSNITSWEEESLSWSEVNELKDMGAIIGGHSHRHINLLNPSISYKIKHKMVLDDKRYLEFNIDNNAEGFAYPFGLYDELSASILIEVGYKYGFTSDSGFLDDRDFPYKIKRTNVGMRNYLTVFAYIEGWSERITLLSKNMKSFFKIL